MEVTVNAIHFNINEKLTAFIEKKADRVARHYPDIIGIDFSLKVVKPESAMNKNVVAKVDLPGSPELVADKTADTFEEAVDLCLEAVERQLDKTKGRKSC